MEDITKIDVKPSTLRPDRPMLEPPICLTHPGACARRSWRSGPPAAGSRRLEPPICLTHPVRAHGRAGALALRHPGACARRVVAAAPSYTQAMMRTSPEQTASAWQLRVKAVVSPGKALDAEGRERVVQLVAQSRGPRKSGTPNRSARKSPPCSRRVTLAHTVGSCRSCRRVCQHTPHQPAGGADAQVLEQQQEDVRQRHVSHLSDRFLPTLTIPTSPKQVTRRAPLCRTPWKVPEEAGWG
jgi:predicted secreted protein